MPCSLANVQAQENEHGSLTGTTGRYGQAVAGLVGVAFVLASAFVLATVQIGLASRDNSGSSGVLGSGITVYACVLTVFHALLRAARVPHPLATLLVGGLGTLVLSIGLLGVLTCVVSTDVKAPLWSPFVIGFVVFVSCARVRFTRGSRV